MAGISILCSVGAGLRCVSWQAFFDYFLPFQANAGKYIKLDKLDTSSRYFVTTGSVE